MACCLPRDLRPLHASLSSPKSDVWSPKHEGAFLPCNAHLFSNFKHTHKELVFTRDFIFGRNFPASLRGKVRINYSGSMGSHYPKSILGACCAQQPLEEMKEICVVCFFLYSYNFCVFRECGPSRPSKASSVSQLT